MKRSIARSAAGMLALVTALAAPGAAPAAFGAPPPGACSNPEPAHPVVRKVPWAQQVLEPEKAWPYSSGAGVTVAVIDSGVDADHPQLRRAGKVLRGRDYFLVGSLPGNYDCVSHGTAVASIIGADRVEGIGFHGLAPAARLLPVRVSDRELTDTGGTRVIDPAVLARGIRFATDQGASVMNLSLSGDRDEPLVRSAIAYAVSKDVLVVAAVGNRQQDPSVALPSYPASYNGVLGVGAIDLAGARLPGSQVGTYVDLVAPGGGVLAATRRGGHMYWEGTSFAAPFVAATAALVRSAWPKLTAAQVTQRLVATATPARGGAGSPEYGAGIVAPFRAVTEGLTSTPARAMPPLVRTAPDPRQLAATNWWRSTGADAKSLAVLVSGGALAAILLAGILLAGRRRRWTPARSSVLRTPVDTASEPPPEYLFSTRSAHRDV